MRALLSLLVFLVILACLLAGCHPISPPSQPTTTSLEPAASILEHVIFEDGIDSALIRYHQLKSEHSDQR
ncbi:MAG: hypothetical protein V3W14_01175, partial [Candidatus Neomarinimicrobiota bacterium]